MRPKFIFIILALVECFLLVLLMSPAATKPKSLIAAQVDFLRTHSATAEQTMHDLQIHVRHFQYFICVSAALVLFVIVGYARCRKL